MTLLKFVFCLTLLCAVTGFPSLGKQSEHGISSSRLSDWSDTAETGKNWLTPYVSLLSSVISSDETASSIPSEAEKQIRDARSSDRAKVTKAAAPHTSSPHCTSLSIKHLGKKVPLIRPTTGNIYKDKSHGDTEQHAAQQAARAAVSANSHSAAQREGSVVAVSNPTLRAGGSPQAQSEYVPRRLDVCSAVWPAAPPQRQRSQNSTKHNDFILEYYMTYEVPTSTTPMTPTRPTAEPVVAECTLPPPYQNNRYDWLEVLAAYGGLPGCVNATQQQPEGPVTAMNDTCERPLPSAFKGQEIYKYIQSDLQSFFREETAKILFPGRTNQILDVRGILVWTAPPDDGNVYVLEYVYDDTGLWLYIPDHTCKFVNSATLTCSTRQDCWCNNGTEACLGVQALPGNLLATLVGGG